ncbi:K(+)/H(+) antiporter [Coemansia guatemalensis]|uniref:K(+)/H(+) antiporter n=1 Tax=Coemansia guatemalensis TaxID=2761395 RepID=A0A9W8HZ74_9FUNG|nr:K(+)/H(+) antiporter [Coemansia guatemalensis]
MAGSDSPSIISGRNPIAVSTSDPLALFIIQLLIIVCICRFLHLFLRWAYQPTVISEILGGILLGPTVLGRWKAFTENVFPKASLVNLNLVANFGLVLFLFMVGLELDPRILKRNFHRSLAISGAGIVLPFGLGVATSYALFRLIENGDGDFVTFMLFCGVAMAITAFPVLARILIEQNLLKTTVGSISISAAAIDDVVSWCLLALVIALTNNSSGITALWVFLVGTGWTLFVMLLVKPLYMWYLRRNGVLKGREPSQIVLFVTFMMVLVSAFFTDAIGIHAIFGGFLVGVIVPHDGGFAIKVTQKIEDAVQIFFLPIYFALSGLKTNLSDLNDGTTWGMLILVCFVAFLGKIVGCTLAARFSKFTWRESLTIGFLMNCKGLVELIVLNIGLDAGVINSKIFTMMVVKALVTTFVTTPAVMWLYPPKYQKRVDDINPNAEDANSMTSRNNDMNAGPPASLLMVLSRIQQVPAIMTLLGYLHHQPEIASRRRLATQEDGGNALSIMHAHVYRPIRVFGLRLLELTGRDSSVMQHYESETQVATDPVMSMFRAFARVANMAFHAALTYSDREHFVSNILHSAQDADAELTIVSAFGRDSNASSDITANKPAVRLATTDTVAPGWFESMGWGFTTEQQASFITTLFEKAHNHVCVFIDCGLAEGSNSASAGTDANNNDITTDANAADSDEGDNASNKGGRVVISSSDAPENDVPGISPAYFVDGRRVPLVVVPFFGGPDDRQALRLAAELCTHSAVQIVVWRFVKADHPTGQDIVLSEDRFPSMPIVPQTPMAAQTRAGQISEVNPWEQTLDEHGIAQGPLSPARLSDREAAEREEDEIFIGTYLQPSAGTADRRAQRESIVSGHTVTDTSKDPEISQADAPAPPAEPDADPAVDRDAANSNDEDAHDASADATGRGGIRDKIARRLRLRHQATRTTADTANGGDEFASGAPLLGDPDNAVSTLTAGVRPTRFPNMNIKTTVTATPLQTLLLHARTLESSDLIVCGRSVRVSLPYFGHLQELEAHTPAGHKHTKVERRRALGTAAEYLLGFGTKASLLVIQASTNPLGLEDIHTKRHS